MQELYNYGQIYMKIRLNKTYIKLLKRHWRRDTALDFPLKKNERNQMLVSFQFRELGRKGLRISEKFSGVKAAREENAVCQLNVSILIGTEKGNVAEGERKQIHIKWNLRIIYLTAQCFMTLLQGIQHEREVYIIHPEQIEFSVICSRQSEEMLD